MLIQECKKIIIKISHIISINSHIDNNIWVKKYHKNKYISFYMHAFIFFLFVCYEHDFSQHIRVYLI